MKTQLIFKISKGEVIVEVQAGDHEPNGIGKLVNFRYPDIMLDCIKVFYQHHRDWLLDGEEEDDFKTESDVATGDPIKQTSSHGEKPQAVPATALPPVKRPPKRLRTFRGWEATTKTKRGYIYKEVISRILEEYKDGVAPTSETFFKIIREMYGEHLKMSSIVAYASEYKKYIRENKLAIKTPQEEDSVETALDASIKSCEECIKQIKPKTGKGLIPMEKVVEIWDLLPGEFEYKQVKALVPAHIMQTAPRIDTTNYIIKQFLDNPAFECAETSPGVFNKRVE